MRRQESGNILLTLMLVLLAMVCVGIIAGQYIARNVSVQTDRRGGKDTVSVFTPAGELHIRETGKLDMSALGVPVYPGARTKKGSDGALIEWLSANGSADKGAFVTGVLVTPDPVDRVADYYRAQLPNWRVINERHGDVRIELSEGGYKRIIVISDKHGETRIAVASTGQPAAN